MDTQDLLNIISVGKKIINKVESTNDRYQSLLILIHLESILDRGRTMVDSLSPDELREIDNGMEEIRVQIVEIMKSLEKKEVQNMLFSEGEGIKTNFLSSL